MNAKLKNMREKIRLAIESAFARIYPEYQFRTGFISDIAEGGFSLPCVWLCPLDLDSMKGRSEGTATYSAAMYLFQSKNHVGPNERDGIWDEMEQEARIILNTIIEDKVRSIDGVSAEVDENSYTGFGELSLKVSFKVMVDFCDESE